MVGRTKESADENKITDEKKEENGKRGGKRKGEKYPKTKHLFKIVSLAYGKRRKIKDIIAKLGISRPSFYRYLEELKRSGIFVVKNYKNGEIEILFNKDIFGRGDEFQKFLVALGYESVGKILRFPYGDEDVLKRKKASRKFLPIKKFLDEARIIIFEDSWFNGKTDIITILQHISSAMEERKGIKFAYEKSPAEEREYTVFPLAIFSKEGDWYLWAYDIDKGKRIFKLTRIKRIISKEIPQSDFPEDIVSKSWRSIKIELCKKMRSAWKFYYPDDGKRTQKVKIEILSGKILQMFKERKFHKSQKIIKEGGKIYLVFRVGNPLEMIGDLASFGPYIKIISPPYLVSEFKKYLKDTLKLYGKG